MGTFYIIFRASLSALIRIRLKSPILNDLRKEIQKKLTGGPDIRRFDNKCIYLETVDGDRSRGQTNGGNKNEILYGKPCYH